MMVQFDSGGEAEEHGWMRGTVLLEMEEKHKNSKWKKGENPIKKKKNGRSKGEKGGGVSPKKPARRC